MRRYTQKEMSEILRLAAEPQKDDAAPSGDFTLEEIQRVAAEVGLNPARVELAALRLESKSLKGSQKDPWHDSVVIPLENVPSASDWEATVAKLREVVGSVGTIRETADSALEWSGNSDVNNYVAVLHRDPARPRLTIAADRTGTSGVAWTIGLAVSVLAGGISAGVLAKNGLTGLEPALLASILAITGGGLFGGLKAAAAIGRAKTNRLRDHLHQLLHQSSGSTAAITPQPAPLSEDIEDSPLEIHPQ